MTAAIVLAVALGAGTGVVPVPDSVQRFPDPSYWPGSGVRQVGNMLQAIADQAGTAMRTSGPGPQQLLARWQAGKLTAAERVSVLLAGGTFRDPVLLPIYADALRSEDLRERKAAAVGLAWTIGDRPPDPNALVDDAETWSRIAGFADALVRTARRHSLVQLWIRSLLVAQGEPRPRGLILPRTVAECLTAIREVAQPEDVNELIALWPLLDRRGQLSLLTTFEIVTVRRFSEPPAKPGAPTGPWLEDVGLSRVNDWVMGRCWTGDGMRLAMRSIAHMWRGKKPPSGEAPMLVGAVRSDYPPLWLVPAEYLVAFGGPALRFDRQWPDDPGNKAMAHRVRQHFPVSDAEAEPRPVRMPSRR